jgi:hypothetical protein
MAAACPRTHDPDAPARAELARLMLEGARRLLREREGVPGEDAEGQRAAPSRRTPAKRGRPAEAKPEGA